MQVIHENKRRTIGNNSVILDLSHVKTDVLLPNMNVKPTATKFLTLLVNYGQNENLLCIGEDLQNNPENKKGFLNPTMKFQLKRQNFEGIAETKPETQAVSNSITELDFKRCFQ